MKYRNRIDAGIRLSSLLSSYQKSDAIVLGLVRGGAVVAHAIARALRLSFDILVVAKIPSPGNSELALGAVAPDGSIYINEEIAGRTGVSQKYIKSEVRRLSEVIAEKIHLYRGTHKPIIVDKKTIILADDGIATGATMKAAILWCRKNHAKEIIVAVPVASVDTVGEIAKNVDRVVVGEKPLFFDAVGQFYETFEQIEDNQIIELLRGNKQR